VKTAHLHGGNPRGVDSEIEGRLAGKSGRLGAYATAIDPVVDGGMKVW